MKTFGIVCEYNPFHEGHAYQIEQTRTKFGATHIVCVMSGTCVQRGELAIYDKWTRAKAAIMGGADLVIELPSAKSLASAEKFAYNAVSLLNSTGIVDGICFGSECGYIEPLKKAAHAYSHSDFPKHLKTALESGMGYHDAYSKALALCGADSEIASSANNLLGIEYIKALNKLSSSIEPYTVKRIGEGHDSKNEGAYPSASFLRNEILADANDKNVHSLLEHQDAALALLRSPTVSFSQLADVSEGIENRLQKAIASSTCLEEIYEKTKTKRYSYSRIRRLVLSACLGLTQNLAEMPQNYIKILALNCKGADLAKAMQNTAKMPVITRFLSNYRNEENLPDIARFECKVSNLYEIFGRERGICGKEFTNSPVFIEK